MSSFFNFAFTILVAFFVCTNYYLAEGHKNQNKIANNNFKIGFGVDVNVKTVGRGDRDSDSDSDESGSHEHPDPEPEPECPITTTCQPCFFPECPVVTCPTTTTCAPVSCPTPTPTTSIPPVVNLTAYSVNCIGLNSIELQEAQQCSKLRRVYMEIYDCSQHPEFPIVSCGLPRPESCCKEQTELLRDIRILIKSLGLDQEDNRNKCNELGGAYADQYGPLEGFIHNKCCVSNSPLNCSGDPNCTRKISI